MRNTEKLNEQSARESLKQALEYLEDGNLRAAMHHARYAAADLQDAIWDAAERDEQDKIADLYGA